MKRSGKGSGNYLTAEPSNSLSSNRPPRKAWEWYYRSFLSRSSSSSNHQHAQPGNDTATGKSPPRNIKQRLKSFGSKLHRRSNSVAGNDLNSSTESKTDGGDSSGDGKMSSSWTDACCSKPFNQPVSMWDSPLPVFPSPSSTVDPYPDGRGNFSPPKHHSTVLSYHDASGRLHTIMRKGGYCGSSSSLTMIDETVNDFAPINKASTDMSTIDSVLFEDEPLSQKKQEQQMSNLSLQMKKYLSTRSSATHHLANQKDHATKLSTEMDSSVRLGSSRGLNAISRAVSANSLSSMPSVFGVQRLKFHDSKSRKLAFTKFHNSAQFSKDSASAFLGDDTSVHYIAMSDPILAETNIKTTMPTLTTTDAKYKGFDCKPPTSSYVGITFDDRQRLDKTSSASPGPDLKFKKSDDLSDKRRSVDRSRSLPAHSSVLNLLPYHSVDLPSNLIRRYTEDGKNCSSLIGPMVLMVCSSQHLLPLLPCMNHSKSSLLPMGMTALGFAKVTRSPPLNTPKNTETRTSPSSEPDYRVSYFVLYHNYLLEYYCSAATKDIILKDNYNIWCERPIGYAHLENSSIRVVEVAKSSKSHEVTPSAFDTELDIIEIAFDGPLLTVGTQIKVLFHLNSIEEMQRWLCLLSKASRMMMDDLYTTQSIPSAPAKSGSGEIGHGRYSTIYSAIKYPSDHTLHNSSDQMRWRALKIVSKDQFSYRVRRQKERADTLLREVTIQSILSRHIFSSFSEPSQVPILQSLGMFETRTHLVLEMELLGGIDLFNYMSTASQRNTVEGGGLDEYEARCIAKNMFEALIILKTMGIAHRDVKPANLLMCCAGARNYLMSKTRAKLCDFGMATFVGADGLVRGRCGTPGFVAPEILLSGLQSGYPNKVDTFSAGVTLYVMLCGYEPFYGESEEQLILANKEGKVEFPDSDWESVSSHAKDLICRLMEPNFANRIEVDEVLKHPWFQESDVDAPTVSEPISRISLPISDVHDQQNFTGCIVS